MVFAWGLYFPASAMMARFMKPLGGPLFFKAHLLMNLLGFVVVITAFAIIYNHMEDEDGAHFQSRHAQIGLSVFVLMSAPGQPPDSRAALPPRPLRPPNPTTAPPPLAGGCNPPTGSCARTRRREAPSRAVAAGCGSCCTKPSAASCCCGPSSQ